MAKKSVKNKIAHIKKHKGKPQKNNRKNTKKVHKVEKILEKKEVKKELGENENKDELVNEEGEDEIDSVDDTTKETVLNNAVKDNFFTFQPKMELFTLLYTTIVFKWVQTDRVFIIVDNSTIGYHLELFLKFFRFNTVFLDSEMPVNTNKHYFNQFLKGVFNICISSNKFIEKSPEFAKESVDQTPIPATIIYFDLIDLELLNYHCFHPNTKAIYHLISNDKKKDFSIKYEDCDQRIQFEDFNFDMDQVSHLRYRCEDIYHSIHKSDIKKAKTKKINQELLYSKNMQDYFKAHPEEKIKIAKSINDNSIKCIKPSATYLPSYLIHHDSTADKNMFAKAINKNYKEKIRGVGKYRKRNTMEKYLEGLDKKDGSHETIKF